MRYRDVAVRLRRLGCEELTRRSGGSHRKWHNPASGGVAALPDWGGRDLKLGTVRAALRDLGVSWEEFRQP